MLGRERNEKREKGEKKRESGEGYCFSEGIETLRTVPIFSAFPFKQSVGYSLVIGNHRDRQMGFL